MKNALINPKSAQDIDSHIDRIHREIDYSEGKVDLLTVRDVLKLDLRYYQLNDASLLDEVVHKLKVGAKQVIARPSLLLEAAKKFDLSALYLPDRKRIYIDGTTPDLKKRWYESHEIAHSVIPWHSNYMLGDNKSTLSPACHQIIESEANFGAGRLLFPRQNFIDAAHSGTLDFKLIRELSKSFGNTITSTLWRTVEQSEGVVFGIIGGHPHHPKEDIKPIEYLIGSNKFLTQFSDISEEDIWSWILSYCRYTKTGPVGSTEIQLQDINSDQHIFIVESFSNGYNVLTIGRWLRPAKVLMPTFTPAAQLPD